MKKIFTALVLVSAILVFGVSSFFQTKTLKTKGEYSLPILETEVSVRFDEFGIPHINSENTEDAYRVLGFIMAGERLFQMDLYRRLVNGSLSEIFGEKTVQADIMLKKLRLKKDSEEKLLNPKIQIAPEAKKIMQAYLDGIHHYIDNYPLPIEFTILGYKPKKFDMADMLGVSGYMALTFAEGLTGDVLHSQLMEKLPEEKLSVIRRGADSDKDYFPDQKVVRSNILKDVFKSIDQISEVFPLFHGSNSWVLSGTRTDTGFPILANDPHIATSNPHIFYEAHVKSPGLEIYGNFIPLIPFAILGHTPHSAWGLTMAVVDDLNVYSEKFDPEDPTKVMFNNEWVEVRKYTETIKVKDGKDTEVEIVLTPHGPLIDGTKYAGESKHLSLSWSVYSEENNVIQSFYELPYAKTIEEFKKAISHAGAPGLNISWVNNTGDIAWWVLGKFPKLPEGVQTDIVLKGWDGTQEMERFYTQEENPHLVNPTNGIIVSANYKPQQIEFDHFDGYWQPSGRFFRLEKLLAKKEKWSLQELKKIQTDDTIPIFKQVSSQLQKGVDQNRLTPFEKNVYKEYLDWNGKSDKESIGSSIYHTWNYYLLYNIFIDELGKKGFEAFGRTADFWHAFKSLLFDQQHTFWDDIRTDRVESGTDIITKSFKESVSFLTEKFGKRTHRWKWGKLHTAEYEHPLGKVKPLNYFFNIGPVEANGGRYVINNLGHRKYTYNFEIVHGPATRRLINMKNPRETYGVLPTGNSGNPFSKHFSDQTPIYHAGKYRLQNMDWDKLKKYPVLKFKTAK